MIRFPAARPSARLDGRLLTSHRAHILLVPFLAATLLAGCGDTRPARRPEGSVAFRSGSGAESGSRLHVVPGPAFQRPGLLIPADEPVWQSAWVGQDREHPALRGAGAGTAAGLAILQAAPVALVFWPAAVGIVVGAAAVGAVGESQGLSATPRMSPPDRAVIAEATRALQPDRLWREAMGQALRHRARSHLPGVTCAPSCGQGPAGVDLLAQARGQGLDGLLHASIDAIGLAVGDERDTFGVFAQVRVRAIDVHDSRLRYERVLSYGPGQPVAGLRGVDVHSLEFLAADQALVYRQLASELLRRMARLLAEDPSLPLPLP